jgi:hypothetical protein
VAGQLEGEVRFDAAADFQLAAGIHGPAAAFQLLPAEVLRGLAGPGRLFLSQPGEEQQVFAFEDRVPLQLAAPKAGRVLLG